MKPRRPDDAGFVERDGLRIHWERHGDHGPAVVLLPTWALFPAEHWKLQVPHLARRHRVIVIEGRGRGRSDTPAGVDGFAIDQYGSDVLAVLDATATDRAVLVAMSRGVMWGLGAAAAAPERVAGLVAIGPAVPVGGIVPRDRSVFDAEPDAPLDDVEGWGRYNAHYWRHDFPGFVDFFIDQMFPEPHSTKARQDGRAWGCAVDVAMMLHATRDAHVPDGEWFASVVPRVHCPVLVLHGDHDRIRPLSAGRHLAEATAGRLVTIAGAGHAPHLRDPVFVNRTIEEFVMAPRSNSPGSASTGAASPDTARSRTWVRAAQRPRRALYLSSPIGLGHALRDVAIAQELRRLHPDLQIDWLTQHPVTALLETHGERVHPASAWLASESAHVEDEAGEHDLHAFQAIRNMDEILVNNFMVFHDVVSEEHYDLVIGDEAWDVDYFLHENPELKSFEFAWMTDFVGWLPMPDGGDREAALTADYNAEMIEQRARYRRIRDRSIFVGDPDDVVPDSFGPELPGIREWTEANFEFAGYITGYDQAALADREALRDRLGYRPDERVCVVTAGGSGVGSDLLRVTVAAAPEMLRLVDGLRLVVVCGPRIDPASLPAVAGVEYHAFVPQLYRHLAACDLAVVQGGLTTCMELTAHRRPFVYVPLRNHFEQNFHVHHRLQRYRAGRRCDYDEASDPGGLAKVVADEIGREVDYLPVDDGGAARAAASIAALV